MIANDQTAQALAALRARFGGKLSTAASVRDQHGHDESWHESHPPDAVLFAASTTDVADAVKIAAAHDLPVIAFGTGTALEGGVQALKGGLSIDLSGMDQIIRLSTDDLDVTVEAGVTREALNNHLRDTGLFFPIDPGANASIGGMAATRASGTNAVRYGTMRENVLALTVVLADGQVIKTASRARKSAAGYDLTRLFVGQEGTLGIITEVTLRLHPIPEAIAAATCTFESLQGAVRAVIETIQSGLPVARIELLDATVITGINLVNRLDLDVAPTLFLEFHGSPQAVAEQQARFEEIAGGNGRRTFSLSRTPEERSKLWEARHRAYWTALSLKPGAKGMPTDVCVPISNLAQCIEETVADMAESPMRAGIVGHVGDGNFHTLFLIDLSKPEELAEAKRLNSRMVERAIRLDGTATGEHGIGYGKMDYLALEHGAGAVGVMAAIKRALDPKGLLNPGKVVPAR